ncbi:helix-turn-helix domain-containing protein [Gallicola sp. Sow4_E12]|uniref:helix-turn-helix domain-containing protein n=1 Tax=Gallicola sp. Sow4_E12 TaxID=3438785 RepID=UPI003F93B45B
METLYSVLHKIMDLTENNMAFNYSNLWKLLEKKKMNKEELRQSIGMSSATLAKLGKNEIISMDVIARICESLKCDVGDIVSYVEED